MCTKETEGKEATEGGKQAEREDGKRWRVDGRAEAKGVIIGRWYEGGEGYRGRRFKAIGCIRERGGEGKEGRREMDVRDGGYKREGER